MGERNTGWIQSYSGLKFYPLEPTVEDITIVDGAHALSMICRYNGHSKEFYSVAQHSVLVSELLETVYGFPKFSIVVKWGLLHDLPEAYLADVPRPIKPLLSGYKDLENSYEVLVAEKFNLPHPIPEIVFEVDTRILKTEREFLFEKHFEWDWSIEQHDLFDIEIKPWPPKRAEAEFLKRFDTIFIGGQNEQR